jgi:hypothetical protein
VYRSAFECSKVLVCTYRLRLLNTGNDTVYGRVARPFSSGFPSRSRALGAPFFAFFAKGGYPICRELRSYAGECIRSVHIRSALLSKALSIGAPVLFVITYVFTN